MTELIIPARFNGPADSGNGGVSAGLIAACLDADATVEVTLRKPPPLEESMQVERLDDAIQVSAGSALIAEARLVDEVSVGDAVEPVEPRVARTAMARYDGLVDHPFPTCFVCGTGRPEHDGLELFSGRSGAGRTATVFYPKSSHLPPQFPSAEVLVWAALDCPGGWAIGLDGRAAVLGRMAARVRDVPAPDEACVVVGQLDGWDGRKAFSRTTLYGGDGRELGRAAATWIELPR